MAAIPQRNKIVTHDEIPSELKIVDTNPKGDTTCQTQTESLSTFMEATSLHGARFVCSGSVFRRLLWSVALISSFAFCIYQVYKTVDAYYNRPFNTKITTKTANKNHLPFPAVTICNYNSFNRRRYKNAMRNSQDAEQDLNFITEMMAGSKAAFTNESRKQHPHLFSRKYGDVQVKDHYLAVYSHRIEDMLLPSPTFESCDINGIVCDSKNFTSFISSVFGHCHTFNSGHDQYPIVSATMAGHLNGLKLLLNIERDSYLDNTVNPLAGLKVLVHDQKTFPFMEQFGFAVQPGVRTLCAIKRKKIINLESPYSANCTRRSLKILRNTSYMYSKPACLLQCLSQFVIKKCGCRPMEYKDLKFPLCAPSDTVLCMFPAYEEFGASEENERCEESCSQPCEHMEYETSLSYASLQKNVFIGMLNSSQDITKTQFPIYQRFLNMTDSEKKEFVEDNIVSLDIYFEDLSYDEIEQTPQFTGWTLIANLGGNFGLFLGMSILTVLEFIDFTFRRICLCVCQQ